MVRPINNSNSSFSGVQAESSVAKSTPDSVSIMTQANGVNNTTEVGSVQEIKKSIQEKKNRIEHLKAKMSPQKSSVIQKASVVAGGALGANLTVAAILSAGVKVSLIAGAGIVGVAAALGVGAGYLVGNALSNYNEEKCQNEIITLENEIKVLEENLKKLPVEV